MTPWLINFLKKLIHENKFPLTVFNNFHQVPQVRQDSAAHKNGDLLHNLDARVSGLPRLLGLTHGFQERKQRRDSQS